MRLTLRHDIKSGLHRTLSIFSLTATVFGTAGCVSQEALDRAHALVPWCVDRENHRTGASPRAVKYVASFGIGPNFNTFTRGTLATTRPSAPSASYQFTIAGFIFPLPANDRVIVFEIAFYSPAKLVSTAHELQWENGLWKEGWQMSDEE